MATRKKKLFIGGAVIFLLGMGVFFTARALVSNSILDDEVLAVALQSDGQSIVGGRFSKKLVRIGLDGYEDESFSEKRTVAGFNGAVMAVAVQADDKIIVGGEFTNFDESLVGHIARLNKDGSLDTDFARANRTGFDDKVQSISIQADGKILCAGAFRSFDGTVVNYIARLNADGTLDTTFQSGGLSAPAYSVLGLSGGQVAVGGTFKDYFFIF